MPAEIALKLRADKNIFWRNYNGGHMDEGTTTSTLYNQFVFDLHMGLENYELMRCPTHCCIKKVLENDDGDAVDSHLEHIKYEAGGDESDKEPAKKESKKDLPSKASTSKKKSKDDDGKKKKDPNAPKRAMSDWPYGFGCGTT
ncbi:FACT complex subunit SSRP1, partial [Mucuna pruriens]